MTTEPTPDNAARATNPKVQRYTWNAHHMVMDSRGPWIVYEDHAATVTALEAEVERLRGRVAQLSDVIGEKELATEDECQVHRAACFELSEILIRADVLAIVHDGGTDAAWKNIIESVKSLTGAGAK